MAYNNSDLNPCEAWNTVCGQYIISKKISQDEILRYADRGISWFLNHPHNEEETFYTALLADMAVKCLHSKVYPSLGETGLLPAHYHPVDQWLKKKVKIKTPVSPRWILEILFGVLLIGFSAYNLNPQLSVSSPNMMIWNSGSSLPFTFGLIIGGIALIHFTSRNDYDEEYAALVYAAGGSFVCLIASLIITRKILADIDQYWMYDVLSRSDYMYGIFFLACLGCWGVMFIGNEINKIRLTLQWNAAARKEQASLRDELKKIEPEFAYLRKYCNDRAGLKESIMNEVKDDFFAEEFIAKCRLEAYGRIYDEFRKETEQRKEKRMEIIS